MDAFLDLGFFWGHREVMIPSSISRFDDDIGWMRSNRMVMCTCTHIETSHRPISRKCSRCVCLAFTPVKPADSK